MKTLLITLLTISFGISSLSFAETRQSIREVYGRIKPINPYDESTDLKDYDWRQTSISAIKRFKTRHSFQIPKCKLKIFKQPNKFVVDTGKLHTVNLVAKEVFDSTASNYALEMSVPHTIEEKGGKQIIAQNHLTFQFYMSVYTRNKVKDVQGLMLINNMDLLSDTIHPNNVRIKIDNPLKPFKQSVDYEISGYQYTFTCWRD